MATEFVCSRCGTVAFRSERDLLVGEVPLPEMLERVDLRQPEPEYGLEVVCQECGEASGFLALGAHLPNRQAPIWVPT